MKQAFSWWCFADRGIGELELLRAAREIGYDGVELIPDSLIDAAQAEGLTVVSRNGHESIADGLNDRGNHDRIAGEIEQSLALAHGKAIPNLIVFSGSRRAALTDKAGADITVAALRRLAPMAEQAGVMLLLELLNSKIDHPGYQADHADWTAEVVRQVGSPCVGMLYDIYHAQIMEGDLIRSIRQYAPLIGHYHTAGNPGRCDLDGGQEIHYPPILRAIAATGYRAYVGHEFLPSGNPIAALRSAYDLTRAALI